MRLAGKHGPTDAQSSKQVTVAAVGNAQLRISQLNLLAGSEALRPRCNRGDVHWCEPPKSYRPGMSGWLIALIKIWPSRVPLGSEAQHPSRVFQVHPQRQHSPHRAGGGGSVTVAPDRRRNLLEPATSSTRSGGGSIIGSASRSINGGQRGRFAQCNQAAPASSGGGSSISGDTRPPREPFWSQPPPRRARGVAGASAAV